MSEVLIDSFNGNNAKLVGCIEALLKLDRDGALVPNGLGGPNSHAWAMLAAAACRLRDAAPSGQDTLRQALEDVVNPLGYIKRRADKEGNVLNRSAVTIANNLSFVQAIASAALAETTTLASPFNRKKDCPRYEDCETGIAQCHCLDEATKSAPDVTGSLPSGESDPVVMHGHSGADTPPSSTAITGEPVAITDEMVELALEAWFDGPLLARNDAQLKTDMRAALKAALFNNGKPALPNVHEYVEDYEYRGDQAYKPNENEQAMLEDAICGYLAEIATPPAAAPDQGVRALQQAGLALDEIIQRTVNPAPTSMSDRCVLDWVNGKARATHHTVNAAMSRPAPDAAGSELPKPLIGAIVAALGQRVRLMHDNGKDQAREDLNAFKKWADAREVVSRQQRGSEAR